MTGLILKTVPSSESHGAAGRTASSRCQRVPDSSACRSSHRPMRRAASYTAREPPTERVKAAEHNKLSIAEQLVTAACASRAAGHAAQLSGDFWRPEASSSTTGQPSVSCSLRVHCQLGVHARLHAGELAASCFQPSTGGSLALGACMLLACVTTHALHGSIP
jgi:hypothetical protein